MDPYLVRYVLRARWVSRISLRTRRGAMRSTENLQVKHNLVVQVTMDAACVVFSKS